MREAGSQEEEKEYKNMSNGTLRAQVQRLETERIVETLRKIQEHEATQVGAFRLNEAGKDSDC